MVAKVIAGMNAGVGCSNHPRGTIFYEINPLFSQRSYIRRQHVVWRGGELVGVIKILLRKTILALGSVYKR